MRTNRVIAVSILTGGLLAGLAVTVAADWITFPASPDESPAQSGGDASGRSANPVRGLLSLPVESGLRPAVVLMPSCEGRRPYHQTWAQALSERGFVALLVDDFFMHDRYQTCGIRDPADRADLLERRLRNALAAARYLSARAEVDRGRIAVMGWGDAPVGQLIGEDERALPRYQVFSAAVAVTPAHCFDETHPVVRPLLVLRAESDPARAGEPCGGVENAESIDVRVYPGTLPGFDDPQAPSGHASGAAQRRYDRLAHGRAIEDVAAFLRARLDSGSPAHAYGIAPAPAAGEAGTWAVNPGEPGPDLPPRGGSAFDAVFSRVSPEGVVHDIPFPFTRLLERLEQVAGGESMGESPLDATLIPLGRSLQREAAAPDYFESPRIVVAVTGEPDSGTGPLGIRLKDRLFLGYQPRSKVLEIISYNEDAARFEFQVVRDYGTKAQPSARYARRALCTSCHQNQAPMFPDATWGETTANPEVARRLAGLGTEFHGVAVNLGDGAVAIDIAADEANLLRIYQRLWSEGCASTIAREIARCRAGAFQAMVQYRLSRSAGFDRSATLYATAYLPLQRRNWMARWPDGLLIPNANLPDRVPLMSPSPSRVPVALDPLRHRPPMDRWKGSSVRDLERLVRGLSRALPDRQVALLDRYLREARESAPGRTLTSPCKVVRRGMSGHDQLYQISCGMDNEEAAAFRLRAEIQLTREGIAKGEAGSLELYASNYARRGLVGRLEQVESRVRIVLHLVDRDGAAGIRAPDGNSVESFVLAWDSELPESTARFDATGTLSTAGDFRPVRAALNRLAAEASSDSPLLADRFDGIKLSGWLLAELGVLSQHQCCETRPMPVPRLEADAGPTQQALSVALEHRGPLLTFSRYCGACHGGDTTYPPGFLHGEGKNVLSAVTQCAERIYYRLSMWRRDSENQGVPPMPPLQGLSLAGTTVDDWLRSESLQRLTTYARKLLRDEGRDPEAVLANPYHAARACLRGDAAHSELASE